MRLHKWSDVRARKFSPDLLAKIDAEVDAEVLEMNLRELRELTGKTQVEVSATTEMNQPELSRVERRKDHLISTLRRYVNALGGELEVSAVFKNKRVKLTGV